MKIVVNNLTEDGRVSLTGYIQEPSKEMGAVADKPAILICPGGAYMVLSDREAEPVALAYANAGFQAFVLRYSVGKLAGGFAPLKEASTAIKMIRDNAEKWHVMKEKIASCGFSAGGHLACAVGLMGEHRPNAMVLGYPAIDFGEVKESKEKHFKIVENLMGKVDYTQEELDGVNLHKQVKMDAPPAFVWHTFEDQVVDIEHTVKLITEYSKKHLPFEYHVFQHGEHGLSLATPMVSNGRKSMVDHRAEQWFKMSVDWLRSIFGELEMIDKPFEFNFNEIKD